MGNCLVFKKARQGAAPQFKAAKLKSGSRLYVTLLPSCFVSQWTGVSRLMLEWEFTAAPISFSVEDLVRYSSTQYVLAVRTRTERYKFWQDVGEVLPYPLYDGETIYDDAVFELWSTVHNEDGEFPGFTFYLPSVHSSCCVATGTTITLSPTWPGRVGLCNTPVHDPAYSGDPHPTLIFSNTTPLCP